MCGSLLSFPSCSSMLKTPRPCYVLTMRRISFLAVFIALACGAQTPRYDLLLRNGRIIDGSGNTWYRGDIAIRGDTIARIAHTLDEPAARVIDLKGQVVAPGFIDIHSHARRNIFNVPTAAHRSEER